MAKECEFKSQSELLSENELEFRTLSTDASWNVITLLFSISDQYSFLMLMLFDNMFLKGRLKGEKIFLWLGAPSLAAEKPFISTSFSLSSVKTDSQMTNGQINYTCCLGLRFYCLKLTYQNY